MRLGLYGTRAPAPRGPRARDKKEGRVLKGEGTSEVPWGEGLPPGRTLPWRKGQGCAPLSLGPIYSGGREGSKLQPWAPPSSPATPLSLSQKFGEALPETRYIHHHAVVLLDLHQPLLPPLGLSLSLISWRMGLLVLVPLAHIGQGAPLTAHVAPRGWWTPLVDPRTPFGTPGTIPIKRETFPATKIRLPIYKSLPPDHSGTSRDVRDLIRDSEQLSGFRIHISLQP